MLSMVVTDAPPQLELGVTGEKTSQQRQEEQPWPPGFTLRSEIEPLPNISRQDAGHSDVKSSVGQESSVSAVPPDGGRIAWTQVLASFLINMNVYGLVNAFGDFQHFYETEYLNGYSSSTISWIGTVQGALTLFIGAIAGPIFDHGYFMLTLRVASIFLVFSWMMLSLSSQYYQVSCLFRCPCLISTTPFLSSSSSPYWY